MKQPRRTRSCHGSYDSSASTRPVRATLEDIPDIGMVRRQRRTTEASIPVTNGQSPMTRHIVGFTTIATGSRSRPTACARTSKTGQSTTASVACGSGHRRTRFMLAHPHPLNGCVRYLR